MDVFFVWLRRFLRWMMLSLGVGRRFGGDWGLVVVVAREEGISVDVVVLMGRAK